MLEYTTGKRKVLYKNWFIIQTSFNPIFYDSGFGNFSNHNSWQYLILLLCFSSVDFRAAVIWVPSESFHRKLKLCLTSPLRSHYSELGQEQLLSGTNVGFDLQVQLNIEHFPITKHLVLQNVVMRWCLLVLGSPHSGWLPISRLGFAR